jgi:hypothetical protein
VGEALAPVKECVVSENEELQERVDGAGIADCERGAAGAVVGWVAVAP